mmetsp:Transcript_16714/g.25249  ORF Transcript_16714/g.25249 Transcript_16714/m.25249 type:complete len:477 (-) Transcript_16714:19-1449(-)
MSNDDDGDYDEDENRERKEAEFEFVSAAYTPEEAWVVRRSHDATNNFDYVHRRLYLPIHDGSSSSSSSDIPIELVLGIPLSYPSVAPLHIEKACLVEEEQNDKPSSIAPPHRKLAMDALPSLIRTCHSVALETAGCESVLGVVSRAEEWINEEWTELVATAASKKQQPTMVECDAPKASYFGRKLLYSHHIIAKSKRKAIGDLAKEYKLGGYFKIGWPGIIIIEGEEENCNHFCDEIRSMRWQYLVIRGEEREEVVTTIGALRRFPLKMTELGEDQMSQLSELCQEAGLDDLFRTSMKIYNNNTDDINDDGNTLVATATHQYYGTLVLVDHMNDPKRYTKWIRKACQSVGCECAIAQCHELGQRPLILVLLVAGEVSSPKQVLKRWRTSRVDVDSKGNPCLERMMNILVEDDPLLDCDDPSQVLMEYDSCKSVSNLTMTETKSLLNSIGGPSWLQALHDSLKNLMQEKKLLLEDFF